VLEDEVERDPLVQFERWYEEAIDAGVPLPEAMTLATATPDGEPSARTVLLKGVDERGFVFFTNYESRKGRELAENPRAALVFHWPAIGRQVRVEGVVERLPREESDRYARARPRDSQFSALASPQSRPVPSREWLEERVAELSREHEGGDLPVRDDWGGYRLTPEAWEFWQHRPNRLHDRFRYTREREAGWRIERLGP
jgi:pyridoxamine 5'-phosphate oxidase